MPGIQLRQPGSSYIACGSITKNTRRIQKFKETGASRYKCQNKLSKAY